MDARRLFAVSVSLIAALWASYGYSKDTGIYIGASLGAATLNEEFGDFSVDDTDFAYKIFGGYQINQVFAIEGGYVDFGSRDESLLSLKPKGVPIYAVGGIPLGPIRLFGKLGGFYWETDVRAGDLFDEKDDGFDFTAGAGLEFELWSLGLRGEIEYFDFLDDAWMYSIGATFTF